MTRLLTTLLSTLLVVGLLAAVPAAVVAKDKPKDACKGGTTVGEDGQPLTKKECKEAAKAGETLGGIIAVAWTDLNGKAGYQPAGDVLIAMLVDDNGTPGPNPGDSIILDRYPNTFNPTGASDFDEFTVKNHTVENVLQYTPGALVNVSSDLANGEAHNWSTPAHSGFERFDDSWYLGNSTITDSAGGGAITMDLRSASKPETDVQLFSGPTGDDAFLEVEVY